MKKVGFLCLNTLAHALHIASIAFYLSVEKKYIVTFYVSTEKLKSELENYSENFPENNVVIKFLYPSVLHRFLRLFKRRLHPRVRNVISNNIKTLLHNDAIVMTDKHMLEYKSSDHPVYIGAGHGAGDRACGFTGTYKNYDYILISGQAKWNRMKKNKLITNNTGKLIGYPKFDIAFKSDPELFFDNNNPVVLYNPHFNNKETSWFKWGYKILEYFLNNPEFNLIFAPHIMLFKNNNTLKSKYFNAENIHIDINSKNLSNMAYTKSADIYLGDVSSQVYEFVAYKRRPCIFLNTHKKIWQNNDNFRMWNMGIVIDDINGLDFGLSEAQKKFETFKEIQKKLRDRTFSFLSEPAGLRAARAIMDILD